MDRGDGRKSHVNLQQVGVGLVASFLLLLLLLLQLLLLPVVPLCLRLRRLLLDDVLLELGEQVATATGAVVRRAGAEPTVDAGYARHITHHSSQQYLVCAILDTSRACFGVASEESDEVPMDAIMPPPPLLGLLDDGLLELGEQVAVAAGAIVRRAGTEPAIDAGYARHITIQRIYALSWT